MTSPAFVRAYPDANPDRDTPSGRELGKKLPKDAHWFVFQGPSLVVRQTETGAELPAGDEGFLSGRLEIEPVVLGALDGRACVACSLAPPEEAGERKAGEGAELPEGTTAMGLRALFGAIDAERYSVAGYAFEILHWLRSSGFCAICGSKSEPVPREWSKRCARCDHLAYPRVSPCVIVLIHDGDRVLLTHKPGWGPIYSLVAGFVEPGESLEECLAREVLEEVGAHVDELRYVGSQPWPFPHQLMVGFFARYRGGELRIDETELDGAAWFHVDALPPLPPRLSIARQLLDAWIAERARAT